MSSDLIYFVVKERDKEDVLIPYRKKVVAHLQVPVMSVKQKYKVPNLLGNKNKKKSGFNFNYCVLEVGFGMDFLKSDVLLFII